MKRFISTISLIASIVLAVSCWSEEEYGAGSDRQQLSTLEAVAGDEEVTLVWTIAEGWNPEEYLISYNDDKGETVCVYTGNSECSYVITGLVNGVTYVFSVQAVYGSDKKLSGIVKTSASPRTSRFPVTDFKLTAADKKITANWTLPISDQILGLTLTYGTGSDPEENTVDLPADATSYEITGLKNFTAYVVAVSVNYPKGPSEAQSSGATPLSGEPLAFADKENVFAGQKNTYRFNTSAYPDATNIVWSVDGGLEKTGATVEFAIWTPGKIAVTVSAEMYGDTISYKLYVNVDEFVFKYNGWANQANMFKNTAPVFSPDGKTCYVVSYTGDRSIMAMDLENGTKKWEYKLDGAAGNGVWINVNPVSGHIYCTSSTKLYALKDEGTKATEVWTADGIVVTGCGCGISANGEILYAGTANTFYVLKASDGSTLGSYASGSQGAALIVISPSEVLITMRQATDNNLQFLDVSNPAGITKIKGLTLPTRGSDICSASVSPDKKYAYISSDRYINCIDLENRTIKKSVELSKESNYLTCGHVVGSDGSVCVVYAQTTSQAQMTLFSAGLEKALWNWAPESHKNTFNYTCPNMDKDGNFYITQRTGNMWFVDKLSGEGTLIYETGAALQGASGFCGNIVITIHNAAPGYIIGKCVKSERETGLWSGPGGDICCSNCIASAIK